MWLEKTYLSFIIGFVRPFFDVDSFWGNILIGDYGILTMTPIFLFGLLLPLVAGFYFLRHLLVDSCIMPRIAKCLDRPLRRIGLSGNSILPLTLGFGCVTVALVSAGTLGTKRERLIASVLLSIAVPCSAQVAVIFALSFLLDWNYMLLYFGIVLAVFYLLGFLLNLLLPGKIPSISLETPSLRMPDLGKIIKKTAREAVDFLQDAGPTFFLGSIAISLLDYYDGFMKLREWFAPITSGFLNLPENATNLFILSIIKRDLGAAGFYSMVNNGSFTQPEILVTLIVLTLFVPCFASQMILFKEQKAVTAILIWIGSFLLSFFVGGITSLFLL
ncbi:nucleoside recognition domain-containing protein [Sinanaerobacter chloroacetimidivorans]|uniref:Ferrous iron transporter B n=1 Tax=Sinanaerobacter chloroacetimidivorans TaxID=2818044 RepID=A0A8J7W335_9FIRM|nr:nucleoside recognition domain-containing protein [Sinanaerobacter chloroacetimidivorans]MBR0599999.1 ferrous iron transporter B [Sinanaerobacter chloroacetimidivorans]